MSLSCIIINQYTHPLLRRRLRDKQKSKNKNADHIFEITRSRKVLSQNIREYHECRSVYIPGLTSTNHDEDHERLEDQPEVLKLWLPSQLPSEHRVAWCLQGIPRLEFCFRYAQADDILADLRRHVKFLQLARDQNTKHIKSTSSTTRSQGILDGFRCKINRLASQYKYARQALLALDPQQELGPSWKKYFLELSPSDLRAPVRNDSQSSEGRFQPSWIWAASRAPPILTATVPSDPLPTSPPLSSMPSLLKAPVTVPVNQGPNNALADGTDNMEFERVQWAKCQARAERYEEEVELTVEEMGRTLRYFEWKRDWWLSFVSAKSNASFPVDVQAGLCAYAYRQSSVYDDLIASFVNHWRKYLLANSLGTIWLNNYPPPVDPGPSRPSRGHRRSNTGPSSIAKVFATSELPTTPHDIDTDPPLESGSDNDNDNDGDSDTHGEIDGEIDAEEMFAED